MAISTLESTRLLPDGMPLHNRVLAALPAADDARIQKHLRMNTEVTGCTLQEHGTPVTDAYFPNGGVFSVTNEMRDGALVEVATVGVEGQSRKTMLRRELRAVRCVTLTGLSTTTIVQSAIAAAVVVARAVPIPVTRIRSGVLQERTRWIRPMRAVADDVFVAVAVGVVHSVSDPGDRDTDRPCRAASAMDRRAGVNEQHQIAAEYTLDSVARLRIVRRAR